MYKLVKVEGIIRSVIHNPAVKSHSPYVLQVDSLSERVEELKQDKKRLVEEYEAKLSKVQHCSANSLCTFQDVHECINKCMAVESVLHVLGG